MMTIKVIDSAAAVPGLDESGEVPQAEIFQNFNFVLINIRGSGACRRVAIGGQISDRSFKRVLFFLLFFIRRIHNFFKINQTRGESEIEERERCKYYYARRREYFLVGFRLT